MKSVLRSRTAPNWTADLTVHDEVYVEDGIRRGKRRLRIDIEFEQVRRGPRPIFRFEAKRLRSAASLRAYLGRDGLGCFLDGRYAKDQDIAGMLGYVQSGTVEQRTAQLAGKLDSHPGTLATGRWQPRPCVPTASDLPDATPTNRSPRPDHDSPFAPGLLLNACSCSPNQLTARTSATRIAAWAIRGQGNPRGAGKRADDRVGVPPYSAKCLSNQRQLITFSTRSSGK